MVWKAQCELEMNREASGKKERKGCPTEGHN